MTAIDVGSAATDREYGASPLFTIVDKANPANLSGKITSVELWADVELADCVVGTFYTTNGDTLKCRDSEAVGAVAAGSKQTKSGLDITVEAGDYIGIYFASGSLDLDIAGGVGLWFYEGEAIDPNDEQTYSYYANRAISVYGIGETVGVDVTIEVPLATVSSQAYAPSPSLGVTLSPPVATVASQGYAPSLALDKVLDIPLALVASQAYAPGIIAGTGVIIDIPVALVSSKALAPVLGLGVTIAIPLATVESEAYAPRVLNMRILAAVRNLVAIRNLPSIREENPQ